MRRSESRNKRAMVDDFSRRSANIISTHHLSKHAQTPHPVGLYLSVLLTLNAKCLAISVNSFGR